MHKGQGAKPKKKENLMLMATGYLTRAIIHKVLSEQPSNVSPLTAVKGMLAFLEAEGVLVQGDEDLYEKLLTDSATEGFPAGNQELSKFYLRKAKKTLKDAAAAGNRQATNICRVISEYNLEKMLGGQAQKNPQKTKIPTGMYL